MSPKGRYGPRYQQICRRHGHELHGHECREFTGSVIAGIRADTVGLWLSWARPPAPSGLTTSRLRPPGCQRPNTKVGQSRLSTRQPNSHSREPSLRGDFVPSEVADDDHVEVAVPALTPALTGDTAVQLALSATGHPPRPGGMPNRYLGTTSSRLNPVSQGWPPNREKPVADHT